MITIISWNYEIAWSSLLIDPVFSKKCSKCSAVPGRACGSVKLRFVRGQPPKSITASMGWLDPLKFKEQLFNKGFNIDCEMHEKPLKPWTWVPLLRQVHHKCHHPMPWLKEASIPRNCQSFHDVSFKSCLPCGIKWQVFLLVVFLCRAVICNTSLQWAF